MNYVKKKKENKGKRKERKRTNNLSNDIKRTDSDMLVQVLQKVTIHKYCNLVSMK